MQTLLMDWTYDILGTLALLVTLLWLGNFISYRWIKNRVLFERRWDYNICCGTTDGGGINADIVRHRLVPNYQAVEDVTRLPYPDGHFARVLSSHTLEHVDDPVAMYRELRRVGQQVTVLVPPLWDIAAAFNPFEHRVIFLTLRSRHDHGLPPFVPYALGRWVQQHLGQWIRADTSVPDAIAQRADAGQPESSRTPSPVCTDSWGKDLLPRLRSLCPPYRIWSSLHIPMIWALSAWTLHAESRLGFLFLCTALIALWLDQSQPTVVTARVQDP